MSIQDMANRWTPKINYGQKMMEKNGWICSNPLISQEKNNCGKFRAPPKIMEKKVQITSLKFWTLTGKTLMEKTETGELSKLDLLFFPP